jgi:hypothetical protein
MRTIYALGLAAILPPEEARRWFEAEATALNVRGEMDAR